MGHMTRAAAFHANGRMFIGERAALVGMTLETRLLVAFGAGDHARAVAHTPGGCKRAMRVVTIRAVHEACVDTMFKRHGELRAHSLVAAIAKLALLASEKELRGAGFVNRMTVGADDIGQGMRRTADVGFGKVFRVAVQASVEYGLRLHEREGVRNGGFSPMRRDVGLAGAVASFATCTLGWLIATGDALVVRVFVKIKPDVGVTSLTYRTADIIGGRQRKNNTQPEPASRHAPTLQEKSLNICKFLKQQVFFPKC